MKKWFFFCNILCEKLIPYLNFFWALSVIFLICWIVFLSFQRIKRYRYVNQVTSLISGLFSTPRRNEVVINTDNADNNGPDQQIITIRNIRRRIAILVCLTLTQLHASTSAFAGTRHNLNLDFLTNLSRAWLIQNNYYNCDHRTLLAAADELPQNFLPTDLTANFERFKEFCKDLECNRWKSLLITITQVLITTFWIVTFGVNFSCVFCFETTAPNAFILFSELILVLFLFIFYMKNIDEAGEKLWDLNEVVNSIWDLFRQLKKKND